MKKVNFNLLLIMLMSMVGLSASAHNIAVKNADGVTIYYNYINNGTELEVTHQKNSSSTYAGDLVIPDEVTYNDKIYKVTRIKAQAFYHCSGINSVTLGNNVNTIQEDAFYSSSLTSIVIPNSVTYIGYAAFYGCVNLTSVIIPDNITEIYQYTFSGCTNLKSVVLGKNLTKIDKQAFYKCSNLSSIIIPNSVTSIGEDAFNGCTSLTSVTIPNSVTSIGEQAFRGCSSLTSVTIPNSVTSIGRFAFNYCESLTSITVPNSVTSMGDQIFGNCTDLSSITWLTSTPPTIGSYFFHSSIYTKATLKVPVGSKSAYQTADIWKNFTNIIEVEPSYNITYIVDGELYKQYIMKEGESITPEAEPKKEGYTFSGWSEIPATMPARDIYIYGTYTKTTDVYNVIANSNGAYAVKIMSPDGKELSSPQQGLNIIKYSDDTTKKVIK